MARTKTIEPVADEQKRGDMVALVVDHLTRVAPSTLLATTTAGGRIIAAFADLAIMRLTCRPGGGNR